MAKGSKNGVELVGDKELSAKFRALKDVGTADLLEAIVQAVAEPIRQGAANRAPRKTGELADTMAAETIEKKKDRCVVGIGPSKDAWYGLFQEVGTSKHGAQPYLRPSFDEGKEEAKEGITDRLWEEIERVSG